MWSSSILLLATAWANPMAETEQFQQQLFTELAPSVVFIQSKDGFGSGVVVSEQGQVLTNRHVVGEDSRVDVVLWDGRHAQGSVIERAADDLDLAVVQLDVVGLQPANLGTARSLSVGAWAASVGHGSGGLWTFTTGMVSNIYPDGAKRPVFQTQIPLNPGASGGPVVNKDNQVIGIVTAGIVESNAINFAIKIDEAYGSLDLIAGLCPCVTITAPKGVPVFVDGEVAGQGPTVRIALDSGRHEVMAVVGGNMVKKQVTWPGTKAVTLE